MWIKRSKSCGGMKMLRGSLNGQRMRWQRILDMCTTLERDWEGEKDERGRRRSDKERKLEVNFSSKTCTLLKPVSFCGMLEFAKRVCITWTWEQRRREHFAHYFHVLCSTDTISPTWTPLTNAWQILKNIQDMCLKHVPETTRLHDRSVPAT